MTMRETDAYGAEPVVSAAGFSAQEGDPEELSEEALDGVAGGGDMPPPDPIDPIEEPEEFPSSGDPGLGDPNDPGLPPPPPPPEEPKKTS